MAKSIKTKDESKKPNQVPEAVGQTEVQTLVNKKFSFKKNPILVRYLAVICVIVIFFAGAFSGIAYNNHQNGVDMTKFWQVYGLVKSNYVGKVDDNKLIEGAITGMVNSLGDPFTSYLPPTDEQSLNDQLSGQFEGIGAELVTENNQITVVTPLPNTPAETAGLKANDIIEKINGTTTTNMSLDDAVNMIRGPKGSVVTLTVLHSGASSTVDLKITRNDITVASVSSKMIGTVGYIEVDDFGSDTVTGMQNAVNDISKQNPTAVIVDLRNNPGGYLEDVPPMAGLFIAPSVVVKEKYKDGKQDELESTGNPVLPTTPMFILINSGSASAAEIFSGAMQDYKRATIIGEQSFGKGSVQSLINLSGNSALKVTIAEWLTPNGRSISKVGITPDVKVTDNKTASSDPVLDKALQLAAGK